MYSAAVDHRIKKYKNTVFIILPNGRKDIPIDPEFYGAHRSGSDEDGVNANDLRDDQDEDKPCVTEVVCPLPPSALFIQSVINFSAFSPSLAYRRPTVTAICICTYA
jgi:hypothetical protein